MRIDPPASKLTLRSRDPRIAIGVIFDSGSIYLTNRTGIANVPGVEIAGCVRDLSATSQQLFPDQGRSTIGTLSFTAVDLDGAITDELRDQLLNEGRGVRGREVRVYTGDTDDFADATWSRVDTYVVDRVTLNRRSYEFSCADRSREQRVDIFDQASTRLTFTITATADTINVVATALFEMCAHTASFTHAPSTTIGYATIKQTGEIFGYTGKTGTSFTGCAAYRGLFGTVAQPVTVEATDNDRKPEVEEFIYIEMPGPQLDYAIKTGKILGTANSLPASWHMGIDEAFVNDDLYTSIGADLYDPSDVTKGLQLRFTHLDKEDGKRFCEEQLHVPMQTFSPISTLGVIGIRRMASLLSSAEPVVVLGPNNVIACDSIEHSLQRVVNRVIVHWNFNGDKFTRHDLFENLTSIGDGDLGHGVSRPLELNLRGMYVSAHSRSTLLRIFNSLTDRYGAPPIEASVRVSRSLNAVEIGDPARMALPSLRDFAGASTLDRTFEVQGRRMNWLTGELSWQVFGSTARVQPDNGGGTSPPLADTYYDDVGTALTGVLTIAGGHVTANGTLTGGADARTAVFYYLGDLTIDAGKTVNIDDNVALFVRGTLTVNGTINGKGRGISAIADPNTVSSAFVADTTSPLVRGTFGSTRASNGITFNNGVSFDVYNDRTGIALTGESAAPRLNLSVSATSTLLGLPSDIRGTPGIYGTPVVESPGDTVRAKGGAGGDGGSGLVILCRGLSFGVAGQIDLSGADGSPPSGTVTLGGASLYAGAGGGGAPGKLYVILDGDTITLPDLDSAFVADHGATPQTGSPIGLAVNSVTIPQGIAQPWTGYDPGLGSFDAFGAANVVQYVPSNIPLGNSDDEIVPAPTSFTTSASDVGLQLAWVSPPADKHDFVQVWRAITNDRSGAVLVFQGKASSFFDYSGSTITRSFWIRAGRINAGGFSSWVPSGSTAGVEITYGGGGGIADEIVEDFKYANLADFNGRWNDYADPGEISFLTGLADAPGGTALRVGNNSGNDQQWRSLNRQMPYDGVSLYEVGCIVRKNNGAANTLYMGVEGIDDDGVTLINSATGANATGSQHYFAAQGVTPGASWTVYRGYFKGWSGTAGQQHNDSSVPGAMYTGVAFVRPMLLMNYNAASGQMDCARVWIRRLSGALNAKDKVATAEIEFNAATETANEVDAGPISVSTPVGDTDVIKYATITTTATDEVSVAVQYRLAVINLGGPNWDVKSGAMMCTTSNTGITYGQPVNKTQADGVQYDPVTSVYTFTPGAGTWRFGLAITNNSGSDDASPTFKDIAVQIAKHKR